MSGSQRAITAAGGEAASSFFILTLDIPFNVEFHAPDPLTLLHGNTPPSDVVHDVAPINLPPSRSSPTVNRRLRRGDGTVTRRRDVIMSRDRTPEVAEERGRGVSVGRHEMLSRPRSRSVCAGKYCSVSGVKSATPAACLSTHRITVGRPHSANQTRRPGLSAVSAHTQRHIAAQTRHKHLLCHNVTLDDNDDTSSSVLGDSGVTSSVYDDVITSRDTSPWSDGSEEREKGGMMPRMTDVDRQSQLRRFLDAVRRHSSSSDDQQLNQQKQQQQQRQQIDVSDDDDDEDDDVCETDTRRESLSDVCDWQVSQHNKLIDLSTSAMDQVRHLVNRRRLPVCPSTQPISDVNTWTRSIKHQSSMTSEAIQRAVLGAAADLVTTSR